MTNIHFYFRLLLILFFPVLTQAQEPFIRQLMTKDGLTQQQVMCYFEDSRGFLWLGTKGGLSRYDGKTFKNYDESDGIPHNIIHNIGEDENGNIWFTTVLGIVCFDGAKFKIYRNETLGDAKMTIINSNKIFINSKQWTLFENGRFVSKTEYFKGVDVTSTINTNYEKSTGILE